LSASRIRLDRVEGLIRHAFVEPFREPIRFGVHGAIQQYSGIKAHEETPATLSHIIAVGGGGLSITAREGPVIVKGSIQSL
jgi:hypothetical protein